MLNCLYTVSQEFENKKIIIYGVNRTSVIVFAKLALNHRVNVDFFLDVSGRFVGEVFVNRKIINIEQLHQMSDAVVIIPEIFEKEEIQQQIGKDIVALYMWDLLDLNDDLRDKKIYIYGIGGRGEAVFNSLSDKKIKVQGVCVTEVEKTRQWHEKEVLSIDQIKQDDECAVIVATDRDKFQGEMLAKIENLDVEKYIAFFMSYQSISEGNFFQVINIALVKHKDIWLYSTNNEIDLYLTNILKMYQIEIAARIRDEEIFDLEYEDITGISVIVAERDEYEMERVCNILDTMGFSLADLNYTAIGLYTCKANHQAGMRRDILIGFSTFESERYPGYVVYGDERTAEVRFMVLGGSTSTGNIYRTVSWVKFLYEKLLAAYCKPVIFNGAVCGHGVTDEFLHMIRDIEPLKPDYVISFSGINNTALLKCKNQFIPHHAETILPQGSGYITGVESDETLYDFWCRMSKLIKLVANHYGARAYSFLQPMSSAKENLNLIETGMFDYTEHTDHIRNFKSRASVEKDMFYVNWISLFEESMPYIDFAHYSTEANKIIADYVFDVIKSDIQKDLGI